MSKKGKRHFLKDKEAKALLTRVSERLKTDLEKLFNEKTKIEQVETDFGEIFLINGKPSLFRIGENVYPTLLFEEVFSKTPKVIVDMGAIPHICNGADIMAPGIVRFEGNFKKGDLVFIVDEKHGKPIALGEIVYDDAEACEVKHGVVVKNIHFAGDKIWNSFKTFY
ncbi:DUF1947 domain-containing protein [Candidatus Bathyarchaeota archaeon]|nr:DUF1947 domain-containing protein [Candidatus Bathyarchaeota archaeon]